jgi:hypothetical protein
MSFTPAGCAVGVLERLLHAAELAVQHLARSRSSIARSLRASSLRQS